MVVSNYRRKTRHHLPLCREGKSFQATLPGLISSINAQGRTARWGGGRGRSQFVKEVPSYAVIVKNAH